MMIGLDVFTYLNKLLSPASALFVQCPIESDVIIVELRNHMLLSNVKDKKSCLSEIKLNGDISIMMKLN